MWLASGLCGVSQLCSWLLLQKICVLLPSPDSFLQGDFSARDQPRQTRAAEGKAPQKCSQWRAPVESREATETFSSSMPFSFSFHVRVWPFGQPWHTLRPECPEHSAFCPVGNEDIAIFLIRHGAFFCSYILLDSPDPSKHLLRKYFVEASALPSSCPGKMVSSLCLWMDG